MSSKEEITINEKIALNIYTAKAIINKIIEEIVNNLDNDRMIVEKLKKINEKITFIEDVAASNEKISGNLEKLFEELRDSLDNLLLEMFDIPIANQILLELRDEVYKIRDEVRNKVTRPHG